jgi:hypothetical protein
MTDLEKLTALLREWGVPYKQSAESDDVDEFVSITVTRDLHAEHPKIGGYLGFLTEFKFSKEGSFLWMGAWE